MFIRRHLWAICFSLCLIGFTVYLLLDTFAIRRVYTVVSQTGSSVSSAEDVSAILAVNGDFYGAQESGYVIRNGVLYRDTAADDRQDLVIYEDGSFEVVEESEVTAQELLDKGAWQVLSFGPGLVEDGEIAVSENEEVGKAMASNPRTALGVTMTDTICLLCPMEGPARVRDFHSMRWRSSCSHLEQTPPTIWMVVVHPQCILTERWSTIRPHQAGA